MYCLTVRVYYAVLVTVDIEAAAGCALQWGWLGDALGDWWVVYVS